MTDRGPTPLPAVGTALPEELVAWLGEQRWFGDRDRDRTGATIDAVERVTDDLLWVLLKIAFADATTATYQVVLPLPLGSGTDAVDRPEVLRWMFPELAVTDVRLLSGEQSNTSVVVGLDGVPDADLIVKVFRRVGMEANPDVEAVRGLWDVGYRRVPEPIAACRRHGRDLAVARRFLSGSTSGWEMALDDPWFLREVAELGRVTAELHLALATAFGASDPDPGGWAADMSRQLARVDLGPHKRGVEERYAALSRVDIGRAGRAVRIHGDYHLGQVLRWGDQWYVLDFEGEPARPVAERTAPSSPLRDVAGMARSFSYAAAVGGLPAEWETEARERFVQAYLDAPGIGRLLPLDVEAVLGAFELDKAVYEVAYERAHRPDWAVIPLRAVERLVG